MAHNMKRNPFSGTGKVFSFTLRQTIFSKGWLTSTIVVAVLLIVGIPLILFGVSKAAEKDSDKKTADAVETVYVTDETEGEADYSVLKQTGSYENVSYIACSSMDEAIQSSTGDSNAVILRVAKPGGSYALTVYLPVGTAVSRSKASSFGSFVEKNFAAVLMQKADMTQEDVLLLSMPVVTETASVSDKPQEDDAEQDTMAKVLGMVVPFMAAMTVYMMVVLYGQSMSNSVMLEKSSKLMETILTAVHPFALMLGKLLATACAAVVQIVIWLFALIGGIIGGIGFALRMVPDTGSETVLMLDAATKSMGSISIAGVFASVIVLAIGFLLYLTVATVSGALASKTEDLNKTNVIYALVIVASLLLCLRPEVNEVSDSARLLSGDLWLRFFPFTAVLVLPSDLILGKIGLLTGIGAIVLMIAAVGLRVWLAATIYKMMVLYRGTPPTPKRLIAMLKEEREHRKNPPQADL